MQALLASCDRGTAIGRRDFAILTLLVRLGCAPARSPRSQLDDIDWRAGELIVRGKGDRRERLPLPADVGEAIAGYLRDGGPPAAQDRALFVRVRAPHGLVDARRGQPASSSAAARRAGLGAGRRAPAAAHRRRPRCCAPARRWPRSARCCATARRVDHRDLRQGRPRRAARARPALAGRRGMSRAARSARRLPGDPPRAGLQARRAPRSCCAQFLDYLERPRRATDHRRRCALAWATLPPGGSRAGGAQRLSVGARLRRATCTRSIPPTRCPPADLLPAPAAPRDAVPLHPTSEIAALMDAAGALRTPLPRRDLRRR